MKVFLTVRSASTRLPDKCFLDFGGITVFQHMIRRCRHFGFDPYVTTTTNPEDDRIEHAAYQEDIADNHLFRGVIDPRQRWMDAAEWFHVTKFHVIDCDDPFFCPLEVQRSMEYLEDTRAHCVEPTVESVRHGTGLMGTSFAIRKGKVLTLPLRVLHNSLSRMTLDYPEDYWMLRTLVRLGADHTIHRGHVEAMLANPLRRINDFRNSDYLAHKQEVA